MFEFSAFLIVIWLAVIVLILAGWWKVFVKAGREGWEGIIPLYNMWVLLKIVGKPGWWMIMYFVPLANIIFLIWTYNMLSKSFGKDEGFTVGLVLLGIIFIPILGFGPAQYLGPYGDKAAFDARNLKDFGQPGNDQ